MSALLDTNVLLRLDDPEIRVSLDALRASDRRLYIAPQCCVEAWVVATRPISSNGLGMSVQEAGRLVDLFGDLFDLLPESPALFEVWRRVARDVPVVGAGVHDARSLRPRPYMKSRRS